MDKHFSEKHLGVDSIAIKIFIITYYQKNADQNNKTSFHTNENNIVKKIANKLCWQGCGEKEMPSD